MLRRWLLTRESSGGGTYIQETELELPQKACCCCKHVFITVIGRISSYRCFLSTVIHPISLSFSFFGLLFDMGTILPYWEKAQLQFYRGRDKYTTKQMFIGVPRRLYQALPAVLLGVLFNALDAGLVAMLTQHLLYVTKAFQFPLASCSSRPKSKARVSGHCNYRPCRCIL